MPRPRFKMPEGMTGEQQESVLSRYSQSEVDPQGTEGQENYPGAVAASGRVNQQVNNTENQ